MPRSSPGVGCPLPHERRPHHSAIDRDGSGLDAAPRDHRDPRPPPGAGHGTSRGHGRSAGITTSRSGPGRGRGSRRLCGREPLWRPSACTAGIERPRLPASGRPEFVPSAARIIRSEARASRSELVPSETRTKRETALVPRRFGWRQSGGVSCRLPPLDYRNRSRTCPRIRRRADPAGRMTQATIRVRQSLPDCRACSTPPQRCAPRTFCAAPASRARACSSSALCSAAATPRRKESATRW